MTKVKIDYSDGVYRLRLVDKEYSREEEILYGIKSIRDEVWEAYCVFRNQMAVWDSLILGWDNELFREREKLEEDKT